MVSNKHIESFSEQQLQNIDWTVKINEFIQTALKFKCLVETSTYNDGGWDHGSPDCVKIGRHKGYIGRHADRQSPFTTEILDDLRETLEKDNHVTRLSYSSLHKNLTLTC